MQRLILSGLLCFLVAVNFVAPSRAMNGASVCGPDQEMAQPCRCCKMRCWYNVAQEARMELGHVPGEAGEQEVLTTLKAIRACMIAECADTCS